MKLHVSLYVPQWLNNGLVAPVQGVSLYCFVIN